MPPGWVAPGCYEEETPLCLPYRVGAGPDITVISTLFPPPGPPFALFVPDDYIWT